MVIRIPSDSGHSEYDLFVKADPNLFSATAAFDAIEKAIRDTKDSLPGEYQVEDLLERLPEGIVPCDDPFLTLPNAEW